MLTVYLRGRLGEMERLPSSRSREDQGDGESAVLQQKNDQGDRGGAEDDYTLPLVRIN